MKEQVLENIINLSLNKQIVPNMMEKLNKELSEIDVNVLYSGNITQEEIAEKITTTYLWDIMLELFKFDEIAKYLLSNFSDAINTENYMAASGLKKQILNRWFLGADDFWRIGRDLLVDLENGCLNSKLYNELVGDTKELMILWKENGFNDYDYVVEHLEILSRNIEFIKNSNEEESDLEVLNVSLNGSIGMDHPVLAIDKTITYFKLLKETESE